MQIPPLHFQNCRCHLDYFDKILKIWATSLIIGIFRRPQSQAAKKKGQMIPKALSVKPSNSCSIAPLIMASLKVPISLTFTNFLYFNTAHFYQQLRSSCIVALPRVQNGSKLAVLPCFSLSATPIWLERLAWHSTQR